MTGARVILQSARLPIFQPGSTSAADIKAWIASQNYFVDTDVANTTFALRPSSSVELRQALANDFNRLTLAAFESAAGVAPDPFVPRSLAWGSIRAYYSAFFAAHGLMRLFGTACVQLEDEHVDQIFAAAQTFGKAGTLSALDAGFFAAEISPSFHSITFRRLRDSHRDTWSTLLAVLTAVESSIANASALSAQKLEAAALVSDARSGLTHASSAKGNWLSTVRNSINYRHAHGVWFPYARTAQPSMLEAASRAWRGRPRSGPLPRDDLDCFFQVATGLVALLRELTEAACALHDPLSPTFSKGCMKLLHEVNAPRRAAAVAA